MANQNMTIAIKAKDLTQAALKNINTSMRKINASVYLAQKRFPKLAKAIRFVGRGARKLAGGLVTLTKRLATLSLKIGAVAAVAGAGIFAVMIKSSMSATDNLAKTARKIGTTTEALSKMRYAADLTGVASTTMDMALQRFTRRTAEAAKGTGEAKDALKELGINARQMLKLPLEEQMLELSKAFEDFSSADKVRLAMKLFDSEGVALVNTLGLGKEALQEMMGEAAALGIVMSTKSAKGVEDANDAFSKLGFLFKGIRDQLTGALAPALEELATALKDKIQAGIDAAGGSVEDFARILAVDIMQAVMTAMSALQSFLNGVIGTFNTISDAASKFTGFFKSDEEKNLKQLQAAIKGIGDEQKKNLALAKTGGMDEGAAKRQNELLEKQKVKLADLAMARMDMGETVGGLIPEFEFADDINAFLAGLVEKYNAVTLAKQGKGTDDTTGTEDDPNEKEKESIQALTDFKQHHQDLLAQGDEQYLAFKKKNAVDQTKAVIDGLSEQLKGTGAISKKLGALEKAAAIKKALIATYESSVKAFSAAGGFPFGIPAAAMSIASGMVQVNAIRSQSFDGGGYTGGGSRSGGVDGKGGFHAILHPQETVIDHTKPNIPSIASKLPSFEGGGYTGGIMPTNSTQNVVNDNREQSSEAQVIVNQTINVTTGVQGTVRAEIANLMPQISEAAQNAVLEARMRGGAYSKQLMGR